MNQVNFLIPVNNNEAISIDLEEDSIKLINYKEGLPFQDNVIFIPESVSPSECSLLENYSLQLSFKKLDAFILEHRQTKKLYRVKFRNLKPAAPLSRLTVLALNEAEGNSLKIDEDEDCGYIAVMGQDSADIYEVTVFGVDMIDIKGPFTLPVKDGLIIEEVVTHPDNDHHALLDQSILSAMITADGKPDHLQECFFPWAADGTGLASTMEITDIIGTLCSRTDLDFVEWEANFPETVAKFGKETLIDLFQKERLYELHARAEDGDEVAYSLLPDAVKKIVDSWKELVEARNAIVHYPALNEADEAKEQTLTAAYRKAFYAAGLDKLYSVDRYKLASFKSEPEK